MRKSRNVDMLYGRPWKQLLIFSIPVFVGYLLQNLYNSVDSIVVGNFVGKEALAAVNATSSITMLLTGFFVGLSTGASVLFARSFGAQEYDKLRRASHTTMLFGTILGVAIAAVGIIWSRPLLEIIDCPEDVFDAAREYMNVYIIGLLFTSLYNVAAGVLRAVGDSRSPFYSIAIASVMNIILDVVLVGPFKMGVIGAALATVISQLVSVIYTVSMMRRMDERYAFRLRELAIDKKILKEVIQLGLPAGVQMSLVSISNMFISRYINSFGSAATGGVGAATRLDQFVSMPSQSLGLAITTYVSQNVGAGKQDRVAKGFWSSCLMAGISLLVLGLPLFIWSDFFMRMFTQDAEVMAYGTAMMRVIIPFYVMMAFSSLLSGLIRGYGYSFQIMVISLVGMVVLRQIYLTIAMAINWNIQVVYFGYPVGWTFQVILMAIYCLGLYRSGKLRQPSEKQSA